jgi:hypothetical protein
VIYEVVVARDSTGDNFSWRFRVTYKAVGLAPPRDGWSESGFAMTRWGAKYRAKRAIAKHKKGQYKPQRWTVT